MIKINKEFLDAKEKALELLNKAKNEKQLDKGIENILDLINRSNYLFTSSSCAGRIALIELPELGDKKGAKFLGKWHRQIEYNEIKESSKKAKVGYIWFLAQSPIFHISVVTNIMADKLLKTAISCGFKNSGIKSIIGKNIVEICSTERLDTPIGKNGLLYCNEQYIHLLVDIANYIMIRANQKLNRLEDGLKIL
jgi:tRNA wybutosine-synthesizing protein 3